MLRILLTLPVVSAHHYAEWYGYEVSNGVYELLGLLVIVGICVWCMLPRSPEVVVPTAQPWPRIVPEYVHNRNGESDVLIDPTGRQ